MTRSHGLSGGASGCCFATPLQVYGVMREAEIRPDNRSLLELVKLCKANDMPETAARIMRERSNVTD